jgi:hypothetical protein
MKARNAGGVIANFRAAGARCVVVSGVVDALHGLPMGEFRHASVTVCRLRAALDELRQRFLARGEPPEQVEEVVREAEEMDASTIAEVVLDTSGLSVAEVAALVRERAGGWPTLTGGNQLPGQPTGRVATAAGEPILWLCGATGVGKSTVGFVVYQKVLRAGLRTAYIDVDQLGRAYATGRPVEGPEPGGSVGDVPGGRRPEAGGGRPCPGRTRGQGVCGCAPRGDDHLVPAPRRP